MQIEEWIDIPTYKRLYKVSNFGRVKSLEKKIPNSIGLGFRTIKERILKDFLNNSNGYKVVTLSKKGKIKTFEVHKLVFWSFKKKTKGRFKVINHKDLNKKNNFLSNLENISQRENSNMKHIKKSSSFTGVSWNKKNKRFVASICVNRNTVYLGSFKDDKKASEVYEEYKKTLLKNLQ